MILSYLLCFGISIAFVFMIVSVYYWGYCTGAHDCATEIKSKINEHFEDEKTKLVNHLMNLVMKPQKEAKELSE